MLLQQGSWRLLPTSVAGHNLLGAGECEREGPAFGVLFDRTLLDWLSRRAACSEEVVPSLVLAIFNRFSTA